MINQLVLIALGTLVTEDLTCIATGVLVAQGKIDFTAGAAACFAGIYIGDVLLYLAGRSGGRFCRRLVKPVQLEKASAWLNSRGAGVIFLSRFVPGLRLPTYVAAGVLKTRFWTFALYFLLAAGIWTPLLVWIASLFGGQATHAVLATGGRLLVLCATWIALRKALPIALTYRRRRLLIGFLKRKVRWEFWPPWAAYLPVIPYILWLGLKHRSFTLFTSANPGIPSGGFVGESKSEILRHLDHVAKYTLMPVGRRIPAQNFKFPVVLKPDVGERGSGVVIVSDENELETHVSAAGQDMILQEYVDGPEFGIFYYRYPSEAHGHILSITEKQLPEVTGDGRSTIEELILRDERAVCLASVYLNRLKRPAGDVLALGEKVRIAELGSHCRGAVFLDATSLKSKALEESIDRISLGFSGFFFGRYDIRAVSKLALKEGHSFKVIELNGVTSEATHIYDPGVSFMAAYQSLFRQWRIAFEIGAINRRNGAEPMPLPEFVALVARRHRNRPGTAVSGNRQLIPVKD